MHINELSRAEHQLIADLGNAYLIEEHMTKHGRKRPGDLARELGADKCEVIRIITMFTDMFVKLPKRGWYASAKHPVHTDIDYSI